ncbi:gluconolactonase [Roseobacter cerasinus]|uniref:Gluconolactonase n=1 Tax=Roseobacter cerasinus TaxID=2602289 RepID=A0A640VQ90_9RHOB|nr:SMP-30/gluconolactonase/LRE family protein [Roseobacter cerasinus]GFE48376.1 gluconolactonase [Roseobacter cerasinus]
MTVELVYPAKNIVGESILWDAARQRLLWVDIVEKKIHALTPATGEYQSWPTPDFVTSIGLRKDGGAIVGLTRDVCLWDFGDQFQTLARVEPDQPDNRLNEGVVGPDGAFWVGTMQNNIAPDGSPKEMTADTGRLYRCTPDGQVTPLCDDLFGLTNTLVWTTGGGLITADTGANEIYRYTYDQDTRRLSDRRSIVSGFERGLPDGSTLDAEGYIWNCRVVGGGCLLRFDPEGHIHRVVDLPCSWPTSCTFGGENLDILYVTSARFTMEVDHLKRHPEEGGVFAIKPGMTGTAPCLFG